VSLALPEIQSPHCSSLMFWDKESETLERSSLEQLQLRRLQDTLGRMAQRVPFYQRLFSELGVKPQNVRSLKEVARLPFTCNADLRANYPNGMLALDRAEVLRLHT
jgi:phenylacetate-CoA ligase